MKHSFVIIGGGIIGLATAYTISKRYPQSSIVVLEKEKKLAFHQSGRNSGVIHSSIYNKPNTHKSIMCREGKQLIEEFCDKHNIPYSKIGKLIVATNKAEVERLEKVYERAISNNLECTITSAFNHIEPYADGYKAIHVPGTGIVDYKVVCEKLAELVNGEVVRNQEVVGCSDNKVFTKTGEYEGECIINCAGLHSDRIARMAGIDPEIRIIPFRGEYYKLKKSANHLVNGLIYPVADPSLPFLGVHFTKMIGGGIECGPNAVLALEREGYSRLQFREALEILGYKGMIKLGIKHWRTGIEEIMSSLLPSYYLLRLRKLIPAIQLDDLTYREPGIRAQAVNLDGTLVDDFLIKKQKNWVHVLNAPSPAATACLSIANYIVSNL